MSRALRDGLGKNRWFFVLHPFSRSATIIVCIRPNGSVALAFAVVLCVMAVWTPRAGSEDKRCTMS
jgi:hypothetical protein